MVAATWLHKKNAHLTMPANKHISHAWEPDYNSLINTPIHPPTLRNTDGFQSVPIYLDARLQLILSKAVGQSRDEITNTIVFTQMPFLSPATQPGLHLHLVTKSQLSQT